LSNDVSLYSSSLGRWLEGRSLPFRFRDELEPLEAALAGASPRGVSAKAILHGLFHAPPAQHTDSIAAGRVRAARAHGLIERSKYRIVIAAGQP
jgi:hypothetical protein